MTDYYNQTQRHNRFHEVSPKNFSSARHRNPTLTKYESLFKGNNKILIPKNFKFKEALSTHYHVVEYIPTQFNKKDLRAFHAKDVFSLEIYVSPHKTYQAPPPGASFTGSFIDVNAATWIALHKFNSTDFPCLILEEEFYGKNNDVIQNLLEGFSFQQGYMFLMNPGVKFENIPAELFMFIVSICIKKGKISRFRHDVIQSLKVVFAAIFELNDYENGNILG